MADEANLSVADSIALKPLIPLLFMGLPAYTFICWALILAGYGLLFAGLSIPFYLFSLIGLVLLTTRMLSRQQIVFAILVNQFAHSVIDLEQRWKEMDEIRYHLRYIELNWIRAQLWKAGTRGVPQELQVYRDQLYERWLAVIRLSPYKL